MVDIMKKALKMIKRKIMLDAMNFSGWKTNRKLVVIESDDWGSIRMPSREVYEKLLSMGDRVDKDPFTKYDALESEKDLKNLMELLVSFKDKNGNSPVFTMNYAMGNPDFERIEESGFSKYVFEPFIQTYGRYPEHEKSFEMLKEGMDKRVFYPQLHCREHLNVKKWMDDLKNGDPLVKRAFDFRMISTANSFTSKNPYAYMDSFNYDFPEEIQQLKVIAREGMGWFVKNFGFISQSFIASCYIWDENIEKELFVCGVSYFQGDRVQLAPKGRGMGSYEKRKHFLGQRNNLNQYYLIRNCSFEPTWRDDLNWVDRCLEEMEIAFKWKKPAIISTHRLNYIGFIDSGNGEENLKLLHQLISRAIKKWPDIEFLTTVELGDLIQTNGNN